MATYGTGFTERGVNLAVETAAPLGIAAGRNTLETEPSTNPSLNPSIDPSAAPDDVGDGQHGGEGEHSLTNPTTIPSPNPTTNPSPNPTTNPSDAPSDVGNGQHGGEGEHGEPPAGEEAEQQPANQRRDVRQRGRQHGLARRHHGGGVPRQPGGQVACGGRVEEGDVLPHDALRREGINGPDRSGV
eukprot:3496934-Pyramimonas_sp.AAC.1